MITFNSQVLALRKPGQPLAAFQPDSFNFWISNMTIKQNILNIMILLFAIGMIVVYTITSDTYTLLQHTEYVDYPYLSKIEVLSNRLIGIQDGLLDALDSRSERSIIRARENAEYFRKITLDMNAIVGKREISREILVQFNDYFDTAESTASIIIGIKKGDVKSEMGRMTVSLNRLTNTLQREKFKAAQTFEQGLVESRKHVQEMLVISLLSALAVFLTWSILPVVSFLPFYKPGSSEDRRKKKLQG
jgi:hypothetical protein